MLEGKVVVHLGRIAPPLFQLVLLIDESLITTTSTHNVWLIVDGVNDAVSMRVSLLYRSTEYLTQLAPNGRKECAGRAGRGSCWPHGP